MHGRGAILRIDLSTGRIEREALTPELCRRFVGGEGINSYLLWQHFLSVDIRSDPLGPDNVLVAGLGPLGATSYGCGSKMKWTFKSPAYNLFGDSVCGGFFAPNLRWAGYDHLVVTGRAEKPVYIWIDDNQVAIRDARHLCGKGSEETHHLLKEEVGDENAETATIGTAGEKLVRYASIVCDGHRVAGRTGGGAVMGSKNLKAIVARGTKGLSVHDPAGFFKAMDAAVAAQNKVPPRIRDGWKTFGTITGTGHYQGTWVNAYRNCQSGYIPDENYRQISHRWYRDNVAATFFACSPGCIWACGGAYQAQGNESPAAKRWAGEKEVKPEYLVVASFGIMTDVADLVEVGHLGAMCRRYGMDVVEVGAIGGMLMELWQRGIINRKDMEEWAEEPLDLEWGNHHALERMIDAIGLQDNTLGQLLKDGVYRAAQRIGELKGCDAQRYALYGKGGAPFIEEVRHTPSWALNMAVVSRGADHLKAQGTLDKNNNLEISQHYFGTPDAAQPRSLKLKGASSAVCENRKALIDSLGICTMQHLHNPILYPMEMFSDALSALTGMRLSPAELEQAGERIVNLEKAFNSRLGHRREHDTLCHRWLNEEIPEGPGKGWKVGDYLDRLKDEYYSWHGWDPATGLQTRKKLEELDIKDVAAVLEREGALS